MEEARKIELKNFLNKLRENISQQIGINQSKAALSEEKIQKFYEGSNKIIEQTFEKFKYAINFQKPTPQDSDLVLSIQGEQNLMSKSAFTDEVEHLNYDTIFAELIAKNNIEYYIPNSFFIARTKRYLLNRENINAGLEKLVSKNSNAIIIGLRINHDLKTIVQDKYSFFTIPCALSDIQDAFFVMDKSDLPSLEFIDIDEKEAKDLQLKLINENIKLYASVIDISKSQNLSLKERANSKNESTDLQVLINIAFKAILRWKEKREVIQINVANQYREEGLQNEISDIKPLKISKEQ